MSIPDRRTWIARLLLPAGIRQRLFMLISLAVFPLLILIWWGYLERYETRRSEALQRELEVAKGIASTFSAYAENIRAQNFAIGEAILTFSPYSQDHTKKLLAFYTDRTPSLRHLSWVSPQGIVLASSEEQLIGRDWSGQAGFEEVVTGWSWTIGDLTPVGLVTEAPTFVIVTSIRGSVGRLLGAVVAAIEPAKLGSEIFLERSVEGAYGIFDHKGSLVYCSTDDELSWEERMQWRQSDSLLGTALETRKEQIGTANLLSAEVFSARVPIGETGWVAGAWRPVRLALAAERHLLVHDAEIAALIAAAAFALAWFLGRSISLPILRLEKDARLMGAGAIGGEDDPSAPVSVHRLRATVTRMATDLLRRADELEAARKAAEEANRAKSEFLANMSHEIRTPMTVFMAAIEHLLMIDKDPERRRLLQMAEKSAGRLRALLDEILDLSRIEARRVDLRKEPFSLRTCLRDAVELFALPAREKGLVLQLEIAPQTPELIVGDGDKLGQVLVNLLANAIKFTSAGEIRVNVAVAGAFLEVSVADTGIGIPAEKRDLIFQSFSQVDSSFTRKYGGAGLGLAISKGLVELMGGKIVAHSREGEGSVFTFTLPLEIAEESPPAVEAGAPGQGETPPGAGILIVEDDPMIREMIAMMLSGRGYRVEGAASGLEALEKWQRGGSDVILMDLQMPGMNGLEATRSIRTQEAPGHGRTYIIGLTAHNRLEVREDCLAAGMDQVLIKPVPMHELYAAIDAGVKAGGPKMPQR